MIVLHGYQQEVKSKIYHDWNNGAANVLAVMPTGAGKSVVTSDIVLDGHNLGMQQTVIAHRNELVSQMSIHIAERGIKHRIIGSDATIMQIIRQHRIKFNGRSFINPSANCTVAGVDTIMSRVDELKDWAYQQDRWITDEAHHIIRGNKWGKAVDLFKNARGLGVTATPSRADGQGLGKHADGVFDTMVEGPTMRQLITWGNLSEYAIVCPKSDLKMDDKKDIGDSGDYSPRKMKAAAERSHIVGDVVTNYIKWAAGKQAICFATDVETAGKIASKFEAAGISAASLSAKTPANVREHYINQFRNGLLMVLVNVDLFGEGFDCPACEVVIMARPTASLGLYLQMIGRALRVFAGKLYGLIIDHVSNVRRHSYPDKPHHWTLDRRDKRGKQAKDPEQVPLTVCTECSRPYERFYVCCPHCGAYPPLPDPRNRTIEMVDGDLTLLTPEMIAKMRQDIILPSAADIAQKVAKYHGEFAGKYQGEKQVEKILAQEKLKYVIAQFAAIQRQKGRTDDQIHKQIFITAGVSMFDMLHIDNKKQDYEAYAATVEGWYNR